MGFIFGDHGAAKKQAAATIKAANMQAKSDTYTAQAAQQAQETTIEQQAAAAQAKDILSTPTGTIDVNLAADTPPAEIDPTTGRPRTARSSFMSVKSPGSGIKI